MHQNFEIFNYFAVHSFGGELDYEEKSSIHQKIKRLSFFLFYFSFFCHVIKVKIKITKINYSMWKIEWFNMV